MVRTAAPVRVQDIACVGFKDWFASWLQAGREYTQDRILADSRGVEVSVLDDAARLSHVERSEAQTRVFDDYARLFFMGSGWVGRFLHVSVLAVLAMSYVEIARRMSRRFGFLALGVALMPSVALIGLHGVFFEVQPRYAFPIWLFASCVHDADASNAE